MNRISTIISQSDAAGAYEQEVFDAVQPSCVLVCAHGNGVRRWDGEKFFYQVADYFTNATVMLVDQNQTHGNGVYINTFPVLIARVQSLIDLANKQYPTIPVWVIAHSMGCAVTTGLDLSNVAGIIFIAPGAGAPQLSLIERYGADIVNGKTVLTTDGLTKIITKEYYMSVKGLVWEEEYAKLAGRFAPIYVYEAGEEKIVGDERLAHRTIAFTNYEIIAGAKHNFSGVAATTLFEKISGILPTNSSKTT